MASGLDPPIEFDLDQEISERITKKKREQPVEKVIEEHEEIDPESHESAEEAVIEPESPEIDEPEEQRNDENEENDDNDDNDEKPKEIEEEAVVEEQTDVDVEEIKEVTAGDTADKDGSETTEPPLADKVRSVRRKGVVAAPSKKPSDSNRDDEVRKVDKPKPEARKKPVSKAETIKEKTERVENTKGFSSVRKTLLVVVNPVPFGLLKVGSTLFSTLFDAVHYKPEKVGTVVEQNHDNFIPTTLEIRYYHNKRDSDDIQQTEAEDEKDNREEPKIQTKRISTKTEPKSENSEETPIEPAKQPAKKVVKSSKTAEKPPALVRRTIDEDLKKFRNRRVDDDRFEVTPLEKLGVLRVRRRNDAQREQFLKEKSQKTIVSTSEIVRRVIHRKGSQGGSVLIDKQSEIKATPTQTVPEATRTVVELSYSRKKGSILASGLPSKVESKVEEEIQPATQPRKTQTSNASQVPKYRKAKITNKSDFKIRYELDEAESLATKVFTLESGR